MPSTIDYYMEALDIVANPNTDWKALILVIAKTNHKVLVEAIKHVRNLSDMGLLEAKEYVESVVDLKDAPGSSA